MSASPFIRRVRLKNYKSIGACDVQLGPLTFLVGPNGAGKSNFLDALHFVADGLRSSLDYALRERGGFLEVSRRRTGLRRDLGIRLDFTLPDGNAGWYGLELVTGGTGYTIQQEQCVVGASRYIHRAGNVVSSVEPAPAAAPDRLYLVNASGLPQFRPVYDALSRMAFHNLNPEKIREPQTLSPGDVLSRDGGNVANVIAWMNHDAPRTMQRVEEYLSRIVPGVQRIMTFGFGTKVMFQIRQATVDSSHPWWDFFPTNMSDGTLRALGVLVALFRGANEPKRIPLVGIEEPELALHPAAAGVLYDALREASASTQVVVTSHSPDLLDNKDVTHAELLSVISEATETKIGPLDEAGRAALRERLYTAGEMLRMNQLEPETSSRTLSPEQLQLFDDAST